MPGIFMTLQGALQASLLLAATIPMTWPGLPWESEPASSNPDQLTIALKYVVYADDTGRTVITPDDAKQVVSGVNRAFAACNVRFRVDEYVVARPGDVGLAYRPTSMKDLNPIRNSFKAERELVLIHTGPWDPSKGLGADGANAWTMMPGERTAGAVIEARVAKNPGLVAHELGHYLGLRHLKERANLMNPVIYTASRKLDDEQCSVVRATAASERSYALRMREAAPSGNSRAPATQAAGQTTSDPGA